MLAILNAREQTTSSHPLRPLGRDGPEKALSSPPRPANPCPLTHAFQLEVPVGEHWGWTRVIPIYDLETPGEVPTGGRLFAYGVSQRRPIAGFVGMSPGASCLNRFSAALSSRSTRLPHQPPDPVRAQWQVAHLHAQGSEGAGHGVGQRRAGRNDADFATALDTQRVQR